MDGFPVFEPFTSLGLGGAFLLVLLILGWQGIKAWKETQTRKLETAPKNNPGTNSNLMRENITAIRENTSELKSMCDFLKANAEQEREHRRECRNGFRRLEKGP